MRMAEVSCSFPDASVERRQQLEKDEEFHKGVRRQESRRWRRGREAPRWEGQVPLRPKGRSGMWDHARDFRIPCLRAPRQMA